MSETTYTVTGMTCGHCVASVTEEVGDIQGVTNVAVDLSSGAVTVTGDRQVDPAEVRAAVEEAGYRLAGLRPAPEGAGVR
ncbi:MULTISPECIES: heavy-metal-associated domain-containing protein [unclassified Parafrankia]|uniref:heavy-metal-associated domain-containing protein n=1 Tax=unclassified Parafrankia TaxID=2994368 RepID=UPI000DA4D6E3|nr:MULTISPECIES: heavy-metal-associated domain-containing protein [unclassified Parafrankia]TCJ35594.1 copper chaperone [Parafrankia sp. BMG5.11]SQD97799.1 Heavy metal transport/detoxification protein [Parafrankia sp. Ea1.12]